MSKGGMDPKAEGDCIMLDGISKGNADMGMDSC